MREFRIEGAERSASGRKPGTLRVVSTLPDGTRIIQPFAFGVRTRVRKEREEDANDPEQASTDPIPFPVRGRE
jgi:hypothetical protein